MRRIVLLGLILLVAPHAAHATVLKSNIPGAHYKANPQAQTEITRVRSRIELKNLQGAMDAAKMAIHRDSLSAEVYDVFGTLALRLGRYRVARDAFEQAAALAPEQAPIWNRLAQVSLLQLGLEEQGLLALRYAVRRGLLVRHAVLHRVHVPLGARRIRRGARFDPARARHRGRREQVAALVLGAARLRPHAGRLRLVRARARHPPGPGLERHHRAAAHGAGAARVRATTRGPTRRSTCCSRSIPASRSG
jgi:hypothetical protein